MTYLLIFLIYGDQFLCKIFCNFFLLFSGVMDKQTLASNNYSQKTDPRYVAGVFKDGEDGF